MKLKVSITIIEVTVIEFVCSVDRGLLVELAAILSAIAALLVA
jgi:uncharacterized membrane protein required for colicin V production